VQALSVVIDDSITTAAMAARVNCMVRFMIECNVFLKFNYAKLPQFRLKTPSPPRYFANIWDYSAKN